MTLKQGIHFDVPDEVYRSDPCEKPSLTQSIAKLLIERSELHAKCEHPRLRPEPIEEPTEKYIAAQAIGNAAHLTMLGRGKTLAIGNFPDWKTKKAQEFRDDATAAGKTPILQRHMDTAHQMVLAAKLQLQQIARYEPVFDDAFVNGNGEVVAIAEDGDVTLRTMIDWMVKPTVLIDFKTTAKSVAPHLVPILMTDAGWSIQAAMQERILDIIDHEGCGRRRFFFVAQENYKPFALTAHELPEATMTMGRKMLDKAIRMWGAAMADDLWPAYPPIVYRPEFPGWRENAWLQREIEDEDRANRKPMLTSIAGG